MKPKSFLTTAFFIFFLFIYQIIQAVDYPAGWTGDDDITLFMNQTETQDGSYSLQVKVNSTMLSSKCNIRSQLISVTAGQSFTFSFYYNTSAHVRVQGVLEWAGTSTTYISQWGGDGIDDAGYVLYTYSGTVPVGATGVKVGAYFDDQSGFVTGEIQYLDNFRFEMPSGTSLEIYNNSFELWQKRNWTEIIRREASDGADGYGYVVAIYSEYAVAADPFGDAAYLLMKDQGGTDNWGEVKKITPSDGTSGDLFGYSVSMGYSYLVIGAPGHGYDASGANYLLQAGAVYIFSRDQGGTGNWGQVAKIVAGDRKANNLFGLSVDVDEGTSGIVVGSPGNDYDAAGANLLNDAGAVYLFEGSGSSWAQKNKFVAGDRHESDNFGYSVSKSSSNIAIGVPENDYDASGLNFLSAAGAVYIFNKSATVPFNWSQIKKIVSSDRHAEQFYGYSVSLFVSTLFIGAPGNDYNISGGDYMDRSGAYYQYGKDQGGTNNWGQVKKYVPPDRHENDMFGVSVSLAGQEMIAGAMQHDYDIFGSNYLIEAGASYIFNQNSGGTNNWGIMNKVVSGDRQANTTFGISVGMGLSGYVIIGNPNQGFQSSINGKVSIFKSVLQSGLIEFRNVTANAFTMIWAPGEGNSRVVFVCEGNTGIVMPQNNNTYSASSTFGSGEQVGSSGWFCVYNGNGYKATVTGLNSSTAYRVMICDYNGTSGSERYFTCIADGNPANISSGIDLSVTNINVAIGLITGTTTEMQYSLNSTNGTDGSWFDCTNTNTSVSFQQGKVYVRQKNLITNFRLVATINPAPAAPSFTINYPAERTNEIVTLTIEYNFNNDFSQSNNSGANNYVNIIPGIDIYFRVKATQSTLPGAVQHLVVPSRNTAPAYTIDYINETTAENGNSTHEYSVNSNMSGAVTATGAKIPLTPGTDLYIRVKATASSFSGEIQHLAVPARPLISYTVDFSTETTKENVSIQDEYSLYQDMSQAKPGAGIRIALTPGENVYFRRKATTSAFKSDILTLIVPDRPEVPVVSLSDRNSSSAVFKKSADGSGEQVSVQDAMEYSLNFGMVWNPITPLVAVDATGMKYIIVRKMATSISFSSQPTTNLDYEKPIVSIITYNTCNGQDYYAICRSNLDNGMIYLIASTEPRSGINDFNKAIATGKGSKAEVIVLNADIQVPAKSLIPGTYYAYATNDYDSLSDAGIPAITINGIPEVDLGPDIIKCKDTYVTIDPGMEFASYSWNYNNAATKSITVTEEDNYVLTVTNESGCYNSDTIRISYNTPYDDEKICIVTIDLSSGKNIIVWEKTPDKGIVTYNLYRESDIGDFTYIGSRSGQELSIYKDITADPEYRSYLYKITITDSCGNESPIDSVPYHWPSFLQYVSSEGGINLQWTEYRIEGVQNIGEYLNSYVIYRGTDSTGLSEYQSVGRQLNFTDKDPDALARKYYYRVAGVIKDPCYPTAGKKADSGPYSHSMSNIEDNRFQTGINDKQMRNEFISIFPNPFSESTTLKFSNPEGFEYKLSITDLSGKLCRIVDNITTSEYLLEKENLKQGFYFVELTGPKIYRGKIVLE
jgi:hypothetical protein